MGGMDYIEWMLWKLAILCAIAFVWNFWRGATGRLDQEGQQEQRDR